MKGIELSFKSEKISVSSNGGLHVIVGQRIKSNEKINNTLHFVGSGKNKDEYVTWHNSELSIGDKVIIEIKDINKNTEPISIRKNNSEEIRIKSKLNTYHKLKKELEEKGLI